MFRAGGARLTVSCEQKMERTALSVAAAAVAGPLTAEAKLAVLAGMKYKKEEDMSLAPE